MSDTATIHYAPEAVLPPRIQDQRFGDGRILVHRALLALARRRVRRGARLLDHERPGWANEIDLERFDIGDSTRCVLGQLFDEPQTIPTYRAWGCATLEAAVRRYPSYTRARLGGETCIANYHLGVSVLADTFPKVPEADLERLATKFGFNDDGRIGWLPLEVAWVEEITKRQS